MHATWSYIIVLLVILSISQALGDNVCKRTEFCNCINITSSGNLEFQCPPSNYEGSKTILHVYRPAKKIRIDCDRIETLNDTLLPDANLSMVTKLELQECPLPQNGFSKVVEKLSLQNLEYLRFTERALLKPLTIDDLKNLKHLKVLELKRNNISVLDGEIFKNTPELSDLMIDENELILNENIFKSTPNLLVLSINSNNIESIPEGTFKHLANLERLFLWRNNLKVLNNGVFDNLVNLKMLELSLNNIETIEDGVFDKSTNLVTLSLRRNKLKNISRRIFQNCRSIELIRMDENPNLNLVDDVFSNLEKLKSINLAFNEIQKVSENLFKGSSNIIKITLNNNRLKTLPKNLFQDLQNLEVLHLDSNEIESIDPELFAPLDKLEYLHLQHNNLNAIDEKLLEKMKNLKEINLSYNRIHSIPTQCLSRNKNLVKFSMSHNQFDFEDSTAFSSNTPFSSFSSTNLKEVDLSHNNISRYPYKLNGIATIETVNLGHNHIVEIYVDQLTTFNAKPVTVDLSSNKISTIHFMDLNLRQPNSDGSRTDIEISNNPIFCDCHALNLARYVQENDHPIRENLVLKYDRLECSQPQKLYQKSLDEVKLDELTCSLDQNCTSDSSCECIYRPSDETLVVECSGRGLTEIPELKDLSTYTRKYDFLELDGTEVRLENNRLDRCPGLYDGYQNTSRWYLEGNAIRNVTWIPDNLKVLDLSANLLETMDAKALKMLNESSLDLIQLGSNPWKCECELKDFLAFLRHHINQIDMSDIRCNRSRSRLVDLNEKDICPAEKYVALNITVVVLFCLFVVTSLISLYFFYQKEILIWLYGRGYCLWLVKEEELDKEKIYDAFVSFSAKDEDFVVENLVSVLESGKEPYRLNIHFRDWIPGELIQTQIINSVRDSRRTIVVLSSNFLESVWGIVEFKTAHNEAMREGRARVILIICGDINMEALDDDLKAYLKTNTYIKWGDPWFWDKLKYALPKRSGRQVLSKKHANMMQFIDDKFKLMGKQPIQTVSTPIILSPSRLEEKPLNLIA